MFHPPTPQLPTAPLAQKFPSLIYSEERTNAYKADDMYYSHNVKLSDTVTHDIMEENKDWFAASERKARQDWYAFRDIIYNRERPKREKKLRDDVHNHIIPVECVPRELAAIRSGLAKKNPYPSFSMHIGGTTYVTYPGWGSKFAIKTIFYQKNEKGKALEVPRCETHVQEYPVRSIPALICILMRMQQSIFSQQMEEGVTPDLTENLPRKSNAPEAIVDDIGTQDPPFSLY